MNEMLTIVSLNKFISFQQLYLEFRQRGTELLGLSTDQVQAHMKWTKWIEQNLGVPITFSIIADPLGTVANGLGMLYSTQRMSTVRGVYFIDDRGIKRTISFYLPEIGRGLAEIRRTLYALQTADQYHLTLPADWPNNNIFGNKAIIPPAATVQQIEEQLKQAEKDEIECLDC